MTVLVRHDLLHLEQRLRDSLAEIFSFAGHALYFPRDDEPAEPVWLPEERRLLLPLRREGELLGVFMARDADAERVPALIPALPGIARLCLDNLLLYKKTREDGLTGLATRQVLLDRLTEEAGLIRREVLSGLSGAAPGAGEQTPASEEGTGYGRLGLLVLRFTGLRAILAQTSHSFADRFTAELAEAFREALPADVLAARTGDYDIAALLPGADHARCESVASEALLRMAGVHLDDPLTGRPLSVQPFAGYTIYPQDLDGQRGAELEEPAPALLGKALLAADTARRQEDGTRILAYGRLLREGGRILATLPGSRVRTSLGRGVGAREGQRFSVWSVRYPVREQGEAGPRQPLYKGEIVLIDLREADSTAEVLLLGDATWTLEPGDTLALLPEEHGTRQGDAPEVTSPSDPVTGFLRHSEFLARLGQAREGQSACSLALIQVTLPEPEPGAGPDSMEQQAQARMGDVAQIVARHLGWGQNEDEDTPRLVGRFALNSLVVFHATRGQEALTRRYALVSAEIARRHGKAAVGLAHWPFLDFSAAELLDCARKALDYALLLPEPHVGVFDSLALNISADKRHCRGDVFGAMDEYKRALLADPDNALAWNSLGVCAASLRRHSEALAHFQEAYRRTPQDASLAYNLGVVHQNLGNAADAARHFEDCLRLAPEHLFAALRRGQLAEAAGDAEAARQHFLEAAQRHPQSGLPCRHLARLALRRQDDAARIEAREHLHKALILNPRDAVALSLMAKVYLDGGEDPELAESLARQSVALRPQRKAGWLELARALETLGRSREARQALLKASEADSR